MFWRVFSRQQCAPGPTFCYSRDFQPFSSHGTDELITKILQHTKKIYHSFCQSDKKIGILLILSHWAAVVFGCCHFFIWQSKGEVSSSNQIGIACFKILVAQLLKIAVFFFIVVQVRLSPFTPPVPPVSASHSWTFSLWLCPYKSLSYGLKVGCWFHLVQSLFPCCEDGSDDFQAHLPDRTVWSFSSVSTFVVRKYLSLFNSSPVEGHLGCF